MQITSKYEQRLQTEWGNQNFIPTPPVPNSWGQLLQLCFPSPSRNLCLSREVSSSKFKAATPKRSVISHCNPRKLLWKLVVQTFAFLLEHGWDSLVSAARLEPETFATLLTADFSMSDKVSHHCHAQLETVEQAWDCVFLVPLAKGQSALRNNTQRDAFPSYFMPTGSELAQTGMPVRETPAQLPPQAVASDHQAPHPFPLGAGAAHLLGPANEIERYNDRRMNAVKDSSPNSRPGTERLKFSCDRPQVR